ncbi:phosphoribosylanthranilate isomerase [Candidatus Oleimmundimicrobium sp.]|uniref:phosphoribosylanthranilate isomerase n=1 Tax=Candidatus Oleimmundimicrobium sp. TaxID=3060597 RepID=UPI00271623B8|nr:phosphoribosylanthranilate isomerase [Candidatus Oleimmundimicrobium sp.]MDO8886651.1 phosphoribosylanthranilate isomerase [Candidatus Oleimmundimicrobium sp.]
MVRIKICGITNIEDALLVSKLGADALGFVFAESPRRIDVETGEEINSALPPFISRVGVFVNEKTETVKAIASRCRLDILQFHGSESSNYCNSFSQKIIKAFRVKDINDLDRLSDYDVNGYLLDTFIDGKPGGTGEVFNWEIGKKAKGFGKPVILSGGLNPGNVIDAINFVQPYAVDVSSGVEERPGKKDPNKIQAFIKACQAASTDFEL